MVEQPRDRSSKNNIHFSHHLFTSSAEIGLNGTNHQSKGLTEKNNRCKNDALRDWSGKCKIETQNFSSACATRPSRAQFYVPNNWILQKYTNNVSDYVYFPLLFYTHFKSKGSDENKTKVGNGLQ